MKRKLLCMLLVLVLTAGFAAGCGSDKGQDTLTPEPEGSAAPTLEVTQEPVEMQENEVTQEPVSPVELDETS